MRPEHQHEQTKANIYMHVAIVDLCPTQEITAVVYLH
jgi:hypothetical protein